MLSLFPAMSLIIDLSSADQEKAKSPGGLMDRSLTHQDVVVVLTEVVPDILEEAGLRLLLHGIIEVHLLWGELKLTDLNRLWRQSDDGLTIDLVALEPPHGD